MNQTISLPKTILENLVERINRLEAVVFGKNKEKFPTEFIKLSPRAKKRYKKMEGDFKKGKNLYSFDNSDEALQFLLSDKKR